MKSEWKDAYRLMRIVKESNPQNTSALAYLNRMRYIAWIRLKDRDRVCEHFNTKARFEQNKIADEIINEILLEERI